MHSVVFYEVFDEEAAALKKYLPAGIRTSFIKETIQESGLPRTAPLISIRTQSTVPESWAADLTGILARSTGYDHVLAFRKKTGSTVPCGYLPDYCARSVAEHAVLVTMALWKKLKLQMRQFQDFSRDNITGTEYLGKNLLAVGVGRIGKEVVRIAKGCGLNVRGVDINPDVGDLEYVSLDEGIPWAQAIVCAVPLTELTRGMLDYRLLKKGRPGMVLVNIARGEIAPIADLRRLLDDGIIAGIGLDVFEREGEAAAAMRRHGGGEDPLIKPIRELRNRDNVILTPHNAFNTTEALERKARQSVQAILYFFDRKSFPSPVPTG